MKILTFVDVHANKEALKELERKSREADLLICAGDISIFGSEQGSTLKIINSWNKPCLILHGNHEDEHEMKEEVEKFSNLQWLHAKDVRLGDISIVGWGGGGFALRDAELEKFVKLLKPHPMRMMVFHGPPANCAIDLQPWIGEHVGCKSRRKVIEDLKPAIAIAGHIHECFGMHDQIGKTLVLNPGPLGMVLELQPKKDTEKNKKKGSKKK